MAELLGEVGGDLFTYNREGWKFGAELRQRDLYQRQKMRIKQVDLYRDDIRDLFDLTVGKMDKYIIVCLVMLAITMELFFKGRNPIGTPSWLFWCWSICTAGAMLYLLMSIWLALHASISAQTFSVRCLTQWLRLPIPSPEEIAKGAAHFEEFEESGTESLLRVPVLGKASEKASGLDGTNTLNPTHRDLTTDWQLFTSHFNLFNHLHRKWQGYEAYARVCMGLGMNHFLAAMSYFSLAVYALDLQSPWAGWAFVAIFQGSALMHARLNLNLTSKETIAMISLVMVPSLCLSVAVAVTMTAPGSGGIDATKYDVAPCLFACVGILGHIGWIIFFLIQTKSDVNGLPVKFSTVWCIDVLGFGMETLREVQEPVGKPTYTTRLPGYSKDGPKNVFEVRNDQTEEETPDPLVAELVPESPESRKRSKLPWVVFKIGSSFTVVLWLFALIQTIVIPFGVDTGIGPVTSPISARRLMEGVRSVRSLPLPAGMTSVRGIISDRLVADEFSIHDLSTGLPVACSLPSRALIHGLTGSVSRPVVLTRETSAIVDCMSGRIVESPVAGKLDAVALRSLPPGNSEIFAISDGMLKYLALDSTNPEWISIKGTEGMYMAGCSLGFNSDEMIVVFDPRTQRLDMYDVASGDKVQSVTVRQEEYVWTHSDGTSITGVSRTGKYRVIAPM